MGLCRPLLPLQYALYFLVLLVLRGCTLHFLYLVFYTEFTSFCLLRFSFERTWCVSHIHAFSHEHENKQAKTAMPANAKPHNTQPPWTPLPGTRWTSLPPQTHLIIPVIQYVCRCVARRRETPFRFVPVVCSINIASSHLPTYKTLDRLSIATMYSWPPPPFDPSRPGELSYQTTHCGSFRGVVTYRPELRASWTTREES